MISGKEIQVLDRNSEYYGVSTSQLMENAGCGVADFVLKKLKPKGKNILFFCGIGNNGGDGFVAARLLSKQFKVTVFLVGLEKDIKTNISRENFDQLKNNDVTLHDVDDLSQIDSIIVGSDVIVDAMLGIGLFGDLREPYSTIVTKIHSVSDKTILSVDVPTGFGTNTFVKPSYTITFHDEKEGMSPENSGEIEIVDIGIPKEALAYVGPGELSVFYPRSVTSSHKGDNGSVLVIGGGPFVGAPALTGMASLRTGADLVFIATPTRSWETIAHFSPNLIVRDLHTDVLTPGGVPAIREMLARCSAVVVGPGLGTAKETEEAVIKIIKLLKEEDKPLVIDADAIRPAGENPGLLRGSKIVITPHEAEFYKLTGVALSDEPDERVNKVKQWAHNLGVTILLKSSVDIICDGENTKLNTIHNPGMTVGGTGDVLSGVIGALLSKGVTPFNAARMGAFVNGEAGNRAFEKKSYGMLATDMIDEIPYVLNKYL